jgi:antitoxin component of MazEF toxin-antitoxin module
MPTKFGLRRLLVDAVKIRRQGNSLSVTLDQEILGAAHLHEGDLVVPKVRNGVVVLTPVEIRPRVLEVGRNVISRNRRVLDRLAQEDTRQVLTGRR